uniref:Uncharacterized protein n=1 Tax=Anguilla anguilla TaxID=7936 RepID=A0A0E9Q192_ANGAN
MRVCSLSNDFRG